MSSPELTATMGPFSCANQQQGGQSGCSKTGTETCSACKLVLYCSKSCREAHWPIHKLDCTNHIRKSSWKPAWEIERRKPAFINDLDDSGTASMAIHGANKYLWGNVPAIDLLQLKENEGSNTNQDLCLLFAASGDPRNFIKTIASLSGEYQGYIHVDINDRDETVVARNVLMILIALNFPPETASDMIIHIWYSAFLTESIAQSIKNTILPIIQDVLNSNIVKPGASSSALWTYGETKLSVELDGKVWNLLLAYCNGNHYISFEHAADLRRSVTMVLSRIDYLDRAMFLLPPSWRVAKIKFRTDGLLLPFGAARGDFNVPNPTFFHSQTSWPMTDFADPLHGWELRDVLQEAYSAKDDIYGLLYMHIRQHLVKFCKRLSALWLSMSLFCMDALVLPTRIVEIDDERRYDRIDVANITNLASLGLPRTISLYGPLLQHPSLNPKATLLTFFLNTATEMSTIQEREESKKKTDKILREFLPLNPYGPLRGEEYKRSAEFLNFGHSRSLLFDLEPAFERYMKRWRFLEIGKMSHLEMKARHTIIDKWPMRLSKRPTKREFELLRWSGHDGSERYVEWRRVL
ncbi:conserved hypothetical protein [Talaromyces stipitatus ATCC 10500]|uniref:MYND-type domain-containing protein n=1 Tax=Talaromyces stipitatus (strain ATCC 10500 / CBS 375.48 / QM 6759 / NRRL 1006) TaxID=441959 RepID=B8MBI7_TALSN|nr:uncharacterized protein TSTA_116410 [Talaromyces stipitatus ATCC 10500]EED17851.1 conserved hypothetical protein [Talaromyces stipitatus ATCC 10500]